MRTDLRLALRTFRTRPGFVLAVVLCLALGIGVNSTVYSIVSAVLLRPLPYPAPNELVAVQQLRHLEGGSQGGLSLPDFADLRDRNTTLASVAAFAVRTVNLTIGGEAEGVDAAAVTGQYFTTLGVPAVLGRTFTEAEVQDGQRVVVLAYSLWERRFASDAGVIGRAIPVDGVPHTIIGVMPADYAFTTDVEQLWLPLDADAAGLPRDRFAYDAIGRLRPGVTVAQADADLRAIGARLAAEHPEVDAGWTAQVLPLNESENRAPPAIRAALLVTLGAVMLVLLIACANVANLMLSHAVGRMREMAIRTALGASRGRIMRQLLTESVLLALAGGAAGALVAVWGLQAAWAAIPFQLPPWLEPAVDGRVLAYTAIVAMLSGVLFGLAPALQAGGVDPQTVLKDGSRGSTAGAGRTRLRDALVAAQLSLSLVLLVAAGLMMKSFVMLQRVDPGFTSRGVLAVQLLVNGDRYPDPTRRAAVLNQVRERLAALPGAVAVSASPYAPTTGNLGASTLRIEGRDLPVDRRPSAELRPVLGEYFGTLRIPVQRGRALTLAETMDTVSRVVVINQGMAERLWPGEDPLGQRLAWDDDGWHTVVGVVPDTRQGGIGRPAGNQLYVPYTARAARTMTFLVRTGDDPLALASAARRAVAAVDPSLAVLEVETLPALVQQSLWQERLFGRLFAAFAVAALTLASVGLYAVVAYATRQRTHEIGVRMALGARGVDVHRLVIGRSLVLVGGSLAVGLVLAVALTRLLASMLYGVSATDVTVFGGVTVALAVVALAATYIPARRAARVDPVIALRAE